MDLFPLVTDFLDSALVTKRLARGQNPDQVTAVHSVLGRTLQYANQNRPVLIEGKPLPVRLSRSRTARKSR